MRHRSPLRGSLEHGFGAQDDTLGLLTRSGAQNQLHVEQLCNTNRLPGALVENKVTAKILNEPVI